VRLFEAKLDKKDRMKICNAALLRCVSPFCGIGMLKGLCHVQDRLAEAETRENQSREEGEKAKADLFQVGLHLSFFIRY
jgi:hypothetical protein